MLVAIACAGGSPAMSRAGKVMRPPPPAMASMKPASVAESVSSASVASSKVRSQRDVAEQA